jgi:hypothetical protein
MINVSAVDITPRSFSGSAPHHVNKLFAAARTLNLDAYRSFQQFHDKRDTNSTYLNIAFQHPIALVNDFICTGILEGAMSCRASRLLVCYDTSFFYK